MKYKKPSQSPSVYAPTCNNDRKNSKTLAWMWNSFINPEKRMQSEGPFLLQQLPKEPDRRKVFDACAGTGVDSIFLLKNDYKITGNELNQAFRAKARANSRREKVSSRFTRYDWLKLDRDIEPKSFDAVICLGNSLTYLFQRSDQGRALRNFFNILKGGGILILDTRNYDYMLDERDDIMKNRNFRYSGNYVYCGMDKVHAAPIRISDDEIVMRYTHIGTHWKGHLRLYPFRRIELYDLIYEAGFRPILFFSDYRPVLDYKADFYQFVCVRPPNPQPQAI